MAEVMVIAVPDVASAGEADNVLTVRSGRGVVAPQPASASADA